MHTVAFIHIIKNHQIIKFWIEFHAWISEKGRSFLSMYIVKSSKIWIGKPSSLGPLFSSCILLSKEKRRILFRHVASFLKKRGGGGRGQNYPKILTSRKNPENPNPLRVGHIPTVSSIFCSLTYFHLKFFYMVPKSGGGGRNSMIIHLFYVNLRKNVCCKKKKWLKVGAPSLCYVPALDYNCKKVNFSLNLFRWIIKQCANLDNCWQEGIEASGGCEW